MWTNIVGRPLLAAAAFQAALADRAQNLQGGKSRLKAGGSLKGSLKGCPTRRSFFWEAGGGFAGLALIDLLSRDARAAAVVNPLAPKVPHFPATAKHAVFLFMNGAPSHIDTFDPK